MLADEFYLLFLDYSMFSDLTNRGVCACIRAETARPHDTKSAKRIIADLPSTRFAYRFANCVRMRARSGYKYFHDFHGAENRERTPGKPTVFPFLPARGNSMFPR